MAQSVKRNTMFTFLFGVTVLVLVGPSLCVDPTTPAPSPCPKGCVCSADNATCTSIDTFPVIAIKGQIKFLKIANHSIETLSAGDLDGYSVLQFLEIDDGNLSTIEAGAFSAIKSTIKKIDLSHNKIENLTEGVFTDLGLETLVLTGNSIRVIRSNYFVNLAKLVELDLTHNLIEQIKPGAFVKVDGMERLKLLQNRLVNLPLDGLGGLVGLKDLRLEYNKISRFDEKYNITLPALTDISLMGNPIYHIKQFPKISDKLETLHLDSTHLLSLPTGTNTWANLKKLKTLVLSGTRMETLEVGMFDGLSNLDTLDLMYMPHLTTIGPEAFRGLDNVKMIDLSYSTRLKSIDETAMDPATKLRRLFMMKCGITYIPQKLVKWSKMESVKINDNPINCDCKMTWAKDGSNFGAKSETKNKFNKLVCSYPKVLKDKKLSEADAELMTCKSLDDHMSRVAAGVIVALCCLVFMGTIAILAANRKRLYLWCRRQYQYRRYRSDMVFTVDQDTSVAELEDQIEARPLKDLRLEQVPL